MPTITIFVPDNAVPTLRILLGGVTPAETTEKTKAWLVDRLKDLVQRHLEETAAAAARKTVVTPGIT